MRIETSQMLRMIARQRLQDRRMQVADSHSQSADELLVALGEAVPRDAVGVHLDAMEWLV